jgi:hypothetical protein
MLRSKIWLCLMASLLVLTSAFFVVLPRAAASASSVHQSAATTFQRHDLALARQAVSEDGVCAYSETHTAVIIDFDQWTNTAFFCGTGFLAHEIAHANDIYDNGGGSMWVKWSAGKQEHFCSISGLGAYWEFSKPVKITQIYYGEGHKDSVCP